MPEAMTGIWMTDVTEEIEAPMPERAFKSTETRRLGEIKTTISGFQWLLDFIFF